MHKIYMKNDLYIAASPLGKHCFLPLFVDVIKNNITSLKTHIIVCMSETG